MAQTISEKLASFITDLRTDWLPADVIEMAKLCVLDWLASAIAGGTTRPIQMFVKVAR